MNPAELETVVHRAIGQLPPPRAPLTLVPRVLAAVETPVARRWYTRPWASWPLPLRSMSAMASAVVATVVWIVLAGSEGSAIAGAADEMVSSVRMIVDDALALAGATRVLWRVFLEPAVGYLVTLVAVMGLAVGLFCAALARVLWEGSAHS